MIDKLRSIAIFSSVVEQGSFRAAAQQLGLAPSRISETVSELEKNLGVTLLYRTTRQLSLTHEGQVLHEKAGEMLAAAESGLDAINPTAIEPSGALRVTAPGFINQDTLMDHFADFAKTYPKVNLELHFTDHPKDLIKDRFDVGIRAGWLDDSEFLTRKIGSSERILVASPVYVAKHPIAKHPKDLEDWDWIRFLVRPNDTEMTDKRGKKVIVRGKSNLSVNSATALFEMALRGAGLTAIPEHLAKQGIDRGQLVHILPNWKLRALGLHAVWPDQSRRENLTTLFVRFLADKQKRG